MCVNSLSQFCNALVVGTPSNVELFCLADTFIFCPFISCAYDFLNSFVNLFVRSRKVFFLTMGMSIKVFNFLKEACPKLMCKLVVIFR